MANGKTLNDYGVENEGTLGLGGHDEGGEGGDGDSGMHVFVDSPDGKQVKLEVQLSETVADLKAKVEEKTGIHQDEQ